MHDDDDTDETRPHLPAVHNNPLARPKKPSLFSWLLPHTTRTRFGARRDIGMLGDLADRMRALQRHADASNDAAKSLLKLEETRGKLRDKDNILADNQADRDHERARKAVARATELAEWENDVAIAKARSQEKLYAALHGANAQKFGHDAFVETLPLRLARVLENAKQGKFDAELEALIVEIDRNKQAAEAAGNSPQSIEPLAATTRHLLTLLDQEIELERQTRASDEALSRLYAVRSRINAKLDEL